MNWVVDIGNSAIKWAPVSEGGIGPSACSTWRESGLAETLDQEWSNIDAPEQINCVCVAGDEVEQEFRRWCQDVWQLEPQMAHSQENILGVSNAYIDAESLGTDRWLALIAAYQLYGQSPACIIDCGTAMTIDAIAADGNHLGGLILPGLQMMQSSLLAGTSVTLGDSEGESSTLFARNTADAVRGGALYAMVATIDRVYADIDAELDEPVIRILCGGDAASLLPLIKGPVEHRPDLVLEGLAMLQVVQKTEKL